jgi:hypothetical protein
VFFGCSHFSDLLAQHVSTWANIGLKIGRHRPQDRHLEAATASERAKVRKSLGSLKSPTVQPITRARYEQARQDFYAWLGFEKLVLPSSAYGLDLVVSDYLEALWAQGKGRTEGSNILAGLQDAQPHLKGNLKLSWRLMKAWATHEVPNRAPPLSEDALHVLVGYSLVKGWTSLLLGFHGLLRTGELLGVQAEHVSVGNPKGPAVISLGLTKAGKRQAAAEGVTLHAEDVCRRLYQWKSQVHGTALLTGPAHNWRKTFNEVITAVGFDCIECRPYSLRRGRCDTLFHLARTF